jgi:hypothetical protein
LGRIRFGKNSDFWEKNRDFCEKIGIYWEKNLIFWKKKSNLGKNPIWEKSYFWTESDLGKNSILGKI